MKREIIFYVEDGSKDGSVFSYTAGDRLIIRGDKETLTSLGEGLLSGLQAGKKEVSLSFDVASEAETAYREEKEKEALLFLEKMKTIAPGTGRTMVLSADGRMYSIHVRRHPSNETYQVTLESGHKKYFLTTEQGKYMYEESEESRAREWLSYDDVTVAVKYFIHNRGERVPRK